MHGFLDVILGGALGAFLSAAQCMYGELMDEYLYAGTYKTPLVIVLCVFFLVRIHPEPADDCPCFDDSVAFAGVIIGVELGNWHYAGSGWAWDEPVPATVPFRLEDMGWIKTAARVLFGVLTIFAWREAMKPALLRGLPPVFRIIERLGLDLPRRFFIQASEYGKVPSYLKDDNVIPSVSEFPSLITSMRHPRRRSVSVGPQSAADAYETLAYRQKRRRGSTSEESGLQGEGIPPTNLDGSRPGVTRSGSRPIDSEEDLCVRTVRGAREPLHPLSKNASYERMMGQSKTVLSPVSDSEDPFDGSRGSGEEKPSGKQEETEEREIFSRLERPRVRYDVEVVTKLIVYAGIGLLAVEINPILFELLGLGMGQ
ncbi:MAG: hypothetical protein M1833_000891 [Piccolia ochrophora]|nr:MAG: hypothetical protein M1833_000891 [Piccolia ochrophora]